MKVWKEKLRNCPILLIDCFCLGTPRLISAYSIWRFQSKLIRCSNLFATRSFFSICYERRILLSVVAVVRYFSEWNECTGSGCGVYKWPAKWPVYWTGQSWPRIHRTNDGRLLWIEVQWSQTHENLPLAWLRYYSFKCPRPSRRQTN